MSVLAVSLCAIAVAAGARAQPAQAFSPVKTVCGIGSLISGLLGKACGIGGKVLGVGEKLFGGGSGSKSSKAQAALGLAAIVAWVTGSAKLALHETAKVISETTSPRLTSTWFSGTYWRVAGIGALFTLPFLFAAAIQALLHSDLALLLRAVLGYLPLAVLSVAIAAPVVMLLLAATDEMCALVSSAAGNAGTGLLERSGNVVIGVAFIATEPFMAFLVAVLTCCGALALWIELVLREAAVYIVVLMLPLAFAGFVWPARRVWAIRAVELLVALILSKFAIVAVLTLGAAALAHASHWGLTSLLTGTVLLILATFAPWAMIRLLPMAELASGAVGSLRGDTARFTGAWARSDAESRGAESAAGREGAGDGGNGSPREVAHGLAERLGSMRQRAPGNGNGTAEAAAALDEDRASDPLEAGVAMAAAGNGSSGGGGSGLGGGGGSGSSGAPDGAGGPGAPHGRGEGLDPMYRQADLNWDPIELGPDGAAPGPGGVKGDGIELIGPREEELGDDPDPLPPEQDPPEGRL